MWPGSEVFILGGGPSIKKVDISRLEGRNVIAVNNAFKLAPWIPAMFFGDSKWYFLHDEALRHFAGLKITTGQKHANKPGILCVNKRNKFGISRDKGTLFFNTNSGACAINLATLLGAKRIVLFGFDMRRVDGELNYHREHAHWADAKRNPFPSHLIPFGAIDRDLKSLHVECVNATPGSAITQFPIVDPESVL